MRGRRNKNHHAQALTRVSLALLAAGLVLALVGPVDAREQKVDRNGVVHRVSVETVSGPDGTGTSIVHTEQGSNGDLSGRTVTGTDDLALDSEPAIAIDPVLEQPVVVWTRDEGSGFDLYAARFDGNLWTAPSLLIFIPEDDLDPCVQAGKSLVHVVWRREEALGTKWLRMSLDRLTLEPAYGPEILPVPMSSLVPTEGGQGPSGGTVDPPRDDFFFGVEIPPREPGDPGQIIVWGVRDEPIPIDYVQSFLMPANLQGATNITAGWVGDRFAVSFEAANGLFYRFRDGGDWSDLRVIRLDSETGSAEARRQMEEMLVRIGPDLPD